MNEYDSDKIDEYYIKELNKTRFLGVGNPSESGVHLLYYFRQENCLSEKCFINAYDIFNSDYSRGLELCDPTINHYVFVDDFC